MDDDKPLTPADAPRTRFNRVAACCIGGARLTSGGSDTQVQKMKEQYVLSFSFCVSTRRMVNGPTLRTHVKALGEEI